MTEKKKKSKIKIEDLYSKRAGTPSHIVNVSKGQLHGVFDHWGPYYLISFEIKLNKVDEINEFVVNNSSYWNVLQLTFTRKSCCDPGDRIPGEYWLALT